MNLDSFSVALRNISDMGICIKFCHVKLRLLKSMSKKRASLVLIVLFLMTGCLVNSFLSNVRFAYGAGGGLSVDLFTNKLPFDGKGFNQTSDAFSPLEQVVLYASVTYNGDPVAGLPVAFQIKSPTGSLNQFRTAITNQSGIATVEFLPWSGNVQATAFGTWTVFSTVSLGELSAHDVLPFQVGWLVTASVKTVAPAQYPEALIEKQIFIRGSEVEALVNLTSISMSLKDVVLTIVAYDAMNRSMYATKDGFQMPLGQLSLHYTFVIPQWVAVGNATIFADVYTADPSAGGIAYSPEASVTFTIALIDVAITSVSLSATELYVGQVLSINVTAANLGSLFETFNVTVYRNGTAIAPPATISLEPNGNRTLLFSWNTSGAAMGVYTIIASSSHVPGEVNTSNNDYLAGQIKLIQYVPPPPPFNPRNLYIVLWIILLIFLMLLLALLVLRRRKRDESEISEQMSFFM